MALTIEQVMNQPGVRTIADREHTHVGGNALEGDPETFAPGVWAYVCERFAVASVLDLGCGIGYSSAWFFSKGVKVVAVDGLRANVERAVFPCLEVDLTKQPVNCRVDLVHCQEVVEHIEEAYLDNLLASLCCGKFILMTNALPGQGGYHHVNEQPSEYWISHLMQRGCTLLGWDTRRIRELAGREGASYLSKTGMLFVNTRRL